MYAWRPHVEHLHYLAGLLAQAGHETRFLTCDSDLPTCYSRELRPKVPGLVHCVACRAGGLRSFESEGVSSISSVGAKEDESPGLAAQWSASSAATLGRFESDEELAGPEFLEFARRLEPAARLGYSAARRWIERERIEGIFLFNGRYDVTRGALEAARDAGVPFVSVERTWFADGLQLYPQENCLGLQSVQSMHAAWRDVPLTTAQAHRAARHIALRFLRQNTREWRAYNVNARAAPWPVEGGRRRVLLTPGSRNETWLHPDWHSHWSSTPDAYDAVMAQLGLTARDVVLRCHPNWGEFIGLNDGSRAERVYTTWAKARGIHVIASRDTASTLELIEQADAIVVCGGSAALEAGILGKQVIAISPSTYMNAGFQTTADRPEALLLIQLHADLGDLERAAAARQVAAQTLRYCHTMAFRLPQYVDYVLAETTTRYRYLEGADPGRLIKMLRTGRLEADDAVAASDDVDEANVLAMIAERRWRDLAEVGAMPPAGEVRNVGRRAVYRLVDRIRDRLPRGDR